MPFYYYKDYHKDLQYNTQGVPDLNDQNDDFGIV